MGRKFGIQDVHLVYLTIFLNILISSNIVLVRGETLLNYITNFAFIQVALFIALHLLRIVEFSDLPAIIPLGGGLLISYMLFSFSTMPLNRFTVSLLTGSIQLLILILFRQGIIKFQLKNRPKGEMPRGGWE
jgi:hypothetical protein